MGTLKDQLIETLLRLEGRYDVHRFQREQKRGLGKLRIAAYLGYGTPDELIFRGRVLRDKNIRPPLESYSKWMNVVDTVKRFRSDEIPGATVRARLGDQSAEIVTNREGFFEFHLPTDHLPPPTDHYYRVDLELIDYAGKAHNPAEPMTVTAETQVLVPPSNAEFGVISDVDDTVLLSNVSNFVILGLNTFLRNAHTRLPFEGVASFYQTLQGGASGANFNPIFYVSSTAWNLYDMLHDFFIVREIPLGPLLLAEFDLNQRGFILKNHTPHKIAAIVAILTTYPALPFILIGDSSEHDATIYAGIVERYPGRVRAIYIRDATSSAKRDRQIQRVAERMEAHGVPLLLVPDSYAAAEHAAAQGFIPPEALPDIRRERDEDEQAPTPLQQALNPPEANV